MAETDPHPITVAIERRIDPKRATESTTWMQAGTDLAQTFAGFLGSGWVRAGESSDLWYMLYRFRGIPMLVVAAVLEAAMATPSSRPRVLRKDGGSTPYGFCVMACSDRTRGLIPAR